VLQNLTHDRYSIPLFVIMILKEMLNERDNWLTREVQDLIFQEFGIEYSSKRSGLLFKV